MPIDGTYATFHLIAKVTLSLSFTFCNKVTVEVCMVLILTFRVGGSVT